MSKISNIIFILIINLIILYFLLYCIEIYLNLNNNTLFKENKFYHREYLKEKYQNVDVAYAPYKLLNNKLSLVPLTGVSNTNTILCNHDNNYIVYKSDKYGFNNHNLPEVNDSIILGDSYVHGLCQDNDHTLLSYLDRMGIKAINFGMMGNGPLLQYATLIEYSNEFKSSSIVWLFNPDNDFYDLSNEITDDLVLKYFKYVDFKQDLVKKNNIKDKIILNYLNYEGRIFKEKIKFYHLDLKIIRDTLQIIIDNYIYNKYKVANHDYINQNNLNNTIKIIDKTINFSKSNNKKLFFVINAITPEIFLSDDKNKKNLRNLYLDNINKIKKFLNKRNIIYFDFNEYIYKNYDKSDIKEIFKATEKGYDHYTKNGNKLLSQKILRLFKNADLYNQ
tara:strand:- start:745 stop:1917 length:1173 start_codon:yes stop_codon:yes gene_type:complete